MSDPSQSSDIEFGKELKSYTTPIEGMIVYDLPVHGDERGWFKENWQHQKMSQHGLPDMGPVQNNISFNAKRGVTRGIHAEPWDKFISIGAGKIFGAWVDLREGPNFGKLYTTTLDPSKAIYVPRGVGNSFQSLEDNSVYIYLVNDHWSAEAQSLYTFLNLADETVNIKWPISLDKAEVSDKDKNHPKLNDVVPMKPRNVLITGANGMIANALKDEFPFAQFTTRDDLDTTSDELDELLNWRQYDTIINAAIYMDIDAAEAEGGREVAWETNVISTTNLASIAAKYKILFINYSFDYVFDGTSESYKEDDIPSPVNTFGQTLAVIEAVSATVPKRYTIRTGWIIGEGHNFIEKMQSYADEGLEPYVVSDQIGRPTFASDLAKFTRVLIDNYQAGKAYPYGLYNYTGDGTPTTWAEIAKHAYSAADHDPAEVKEVSTGQYSDMKPDTAKRPLNNVLSLEKVKALGIVPTDWEKALEEYFAKHRKR